MAKRPEPPFNPLFKDRKNPYYPPRHCMAVVRCKECGEMYEPICRIDHECKKANSYPYEGVDLLDEKQETN